MHPLVGRNCIRGGDERCGGGSVRIQSESEGAVRNNSGAIAPLIGTGKDESSGVLVAVKDSGPGLNPKSFDRLFDAFYTTKPGGMGMGLSICRSIVEAHGGRIWVSRTDGPGATLQFTLPVGESVQREATLVVAPRHLNGSLSF